MWRSTVLSFSLQFVFPGETLLSLLARIVKDDEAKKSWNVDNRRIDFEDFFLHPFLDLEHVPSEDSYEKSAVLIEKAVSLDRDGDLDEALVMYR